MSLQSLFQDASVAGVLLDKRLEGTSELGGYIN